MNNIGKIISVVKTLVDMAEEDTGDQYFELVHAIALILPRHCQDCLRQLVNGPVYDGDISSKIARSELFEMGLAIRVCCKGEQGFTGSKYTGYSIIKKLDELKA